MSTQASNRYLDHLIGSGFQGVNWLFVLKFDVNTNRLGHSRYYLPTTKIEDYHVVIDGKSFFDQPIKNDIKTYETIRKVLFDQPIKNDIKTYETIRKVSTCQGDDYTTGCLLGYSFSIKIIKW